MYRIKNLLPGIKIKATHRIYLILVCSKKKIKATHRITMKKYTPVDAGYHFSWKMSKQYHLCKLTQSKRWFGKFHSILIFLNISKTVSQIKLKFKLF